MQESTGRTSSQRRRNLDGDQNARYKPPRVARTYERRHVFPNVVVEDFFEVQSRPAELSISSRKTWLVFRRIFFMDPRANEYIIARPPVKKFSNGSPLDFSKRTSSESSSASVDRFCISFLFLFFFFFFV